MTLGTQITAAHRSASSVFDVIPTGAALAAEVTGVDLRYLDDTTFGRLVDAWHQHSVLLVRGQSLSDQDLIAFSRRFGDLDWGADPGKWPSVRRGFTGNLYCLQRQSGR